MNTEVAGQVKRLPKKLWYLGKLMAKLARTSYTYLRTAHMYKMKITRLEHERDTRLEELKQEQKRLTEQVFSFAAERKDEIMKGGKSITLATGQVGWRAINPSVEIESGHTEKTVAMWITTRYKKYLRFTPKLNKEKILQDFRDGVLRKIKGLKIRQGEELFISLSPRGKEKPETITITEVSL